MQNSGEDIVRRFEKLDADRGTYKAHIQEIAEYMIPVKATVTTQGTLGAKRSSRIFDGTATKALRIFANGLYGHMTSPGAPWFELTTKDKALARMPAVKAWLRDTSQRMRDALSASNFGMGIHEVYTDLGWCGTGNIFVTEGTRRPLNFVTFNIGRVCLDENAEGVVDAVYRLEPYTVRQIVQTWGKKASKKIQDAATKSPDEKHDVIHAVFPRQDVELFYDKQSKLRRLKWGRENMPIASLYVERESKNVLEVGGYLEMPYMTPRWLRDSEEINGRGPGMDALADTKMLNEMSKTDIKAMQKIADPPLLVPDEMRLSPMRLTPGGLNYYKPGPGEGPRPLYVPDRIQVNLEYENQRRQAINDCFFVDLFTLLASRDKNMTATEVLELAEEKLALLGPALGRLQVELYDPLLSRVFWILYRAGYLAPVPEELRDEGIEVDYISKLAMAMRAFETKAAQGALTFTGTLVQATQDQSAWDVYDLDKINRGVAERYGTPQEWLRPESEVRKLREERQAAAEKAAQEQGMRDLAAAVPVEKKVEDGSLLDQIIQGGKASAGAQ